MLVRNGIHLTIEFQIVFQFPAAGVQRPVIFVYSFNLGREDVHRGQRAFPEILYLFHSRQIGQALFRRSPGQGGTREADGEKPGFNGRNGAQTEKVAPFYNRNHNQFLVCLCRRKRSAVSATRPQQRRRTAGPTGGLFARAFRPRSRLPGRPDARRPPRQR